MNQSEILEKSRKENRNQDLFEMEVLKEAGRAGSITAFLLSSAIFLLEVSLGRGMNYGLYAVCFSILAATFLVKAVKMKRRHEILLAALYCTATLAAMLAHIFSLLPL